MPPYERGLDRAATASNALRVTSRSGYLGGSTSSSAPHLSQTHAIYCPRCVVCRLGRRLLSPRGRFRDGTVRVIERSWKLARLEWTKPNRPVDVSNVLKVSRGFWARIQERHLPSKDRTHQSYWGREVGVVRDDDRHVIFIRERIDKEIAGEIDIRSFLFLLDDVDRLDGEQRRWTFCCRVRDPSLFDVCRKSSLMHRQSGNGLQCP